MDRNDVMRAKPTLNTLLALDGIEWSYWRFAVLRHLIANDRVGFVFTRDGDLLVRLKKVKADGGFVMNERGTVVLDPPIVMDTLDKLNRLGIYDKEEVVDILEKSLKLVEDDA